MPNAKFIPAATWALLPEFNVEAGDNVAPLLDAGTYYPVLSDVASVTVSAAAETDLVMTIETTAPNETFTLPFRNGGTYAANVDMGNGDPAFNITTYNDPALTATYPTAGTHEIRVSGEIFGLLFLNAADRAKLRTVTNLGNLNYKTMQSAFTGCTGLTSFVAGNCTTASVANWFKAFEGCDALVSVDLTGIDWNSTTNLQNTWAGCDALTTINFEVVDTSNVTRMDECFHNCPLLVNLDMSNIDVSSLSATGGMFNFIDGADIKQADYDAALIRIASQAPLTDGVFFGSNLDQLYTIGGAAEAARTTIIQEGWFLNDSGSAVPQAMGAPSLVVDSATQLTATNGAAPPLDGLPISGYDLRYSVQGADTWTTDVSITSPRAITGLTDGLTYEVQTRAKNYLGAGAWSPSAVATTTAAASFGVDNAGEEPVITPDGSGNISVTVASGTYAGTYTTRATDGATLTTAMVTAAATPIVMPTVTGSTGDGDTLTIVPGLWLYEGADPGDQTFQQQLDGVNVLNGTGLTYLIATADENAAFTVEETFDGVTIESDPLTLVFAASPLAADAGAQFWYSPSNKVVNGSDVLTAWPDNATGATGLYDLVGTSTAATLPTWDATANAAVFTAASPKVIRSGTDFQHLLQSKVAVDNSTLIFMNVIETVTPTAWHDFFSMIGNTEFTNHVFALGYNGSASDITLGVYARGVSTQPFGTKFSNYATTNVVPVGKMLYELHVSQTDWSVYIDGVLEFTGSVTVANMPNIASARVNLGAFANSTEVSRSHEGKIHEVFCTTSLNDVATLRADLMTRHGL